MGSAGRTTRSDSIVSRPSPAASTSAGLAEPDARPEQTPERPPRRCERRLARAVACEPGAQHAGDGAVEIGDGGQQRRPGLARRALVRAVEAAWDGNAARADRPRPRCPGCAGRWPQACRGSAWPRRTAAAPPRATRSGPVVVLARSLGAPAAAGSGTGAPRPARRGRCGAGRCGRSGRAGRHCCAVAKSTQRPAAPLPLSGPVSRTMRLRPGVLSTSPTRQVPPSRRPLERYSRHTASAFCARRRASRQRVPCHAPSRSAIRCSG